MWLFLLPFESCLDLEANKWSVKIRVYCDVSVCLFVNEAEVGYNKKEQVSVIKQPGSVYVV